MERKRDAQRICDNTYILANRLSREYRDQQDSYVQRKFDELWHAAQHRDEY